MATDYTYLLVEFPDTISSDQLYRICKISKRKAKWLLDNHIIPCQDSGKKTRRYKIRTADVMEYLIARETDPKAVSPPVGLFNSKVKKPNPIALIDRDEFQRFLYGVWTKEPEAMTTKEIHVLTGYSLGTVGQWICREKLKSTKLPTVRVVAKEWLVEYICEYTISNPSRLSHINLQLVTEYMKTM